MRRTAVILSLLMVGLLSFAFPTTAAYPDDDTLIIDLADFNGSNTANYMLTGDVSAAVEVLNGNYLASFGGVNHVLQGVHSVNPSRVRFGVTFTSDTVNVVPTEMRYKVQTSNHPGYGEIYASPSSNGFWGHVGHNTNGTWQDITLTAETSRPNGYVEFTANGVLYLELNFHTPSSSSSRRMYVGDEIQVDIDYIERAAVGEYGRPFTSGDEDDEWDFWEYDYSSLLTPQNIYDYTVVATSSSQDAFVHAAFAGTVTVVEKLTAARCSDVLSDTPVLAVFFVCQIWVPSEITGETTESLYGIEGFGRDFSAEAVLSAWRIVIESAADPTTTLEYFVRDGDLYIEAGSQIQEGCVLGKSLRLTGIAPNLRGLFSGVDVIFPESNKGITVLNLFENTENAELLPNFKTTYPNNDQPCNTPPEYQNCQGGTLLDKPENWTVSDGASVDAPGATLGRFSYIEYNFPLNSDPNRHPQVRVNARAEAQPASLSVQFGQTTQSFSVSTLDYQDYTIEGDAHQADVGGLYNLRLQNNSEFTISVRYLCISFTLDESLDPVSPPPPPTCYFQNPSFVNGTSGWTTTGGVSSGTGEIHVPSGGTFSQVVTLHPDGEDPQTYTIRVRGGIRYYVSYTPDETEVTETLDLDYDFPNDPPDEDLGSATFGQLAQANNEYTFSTTFVISEETTGEFIFYPVLISAPGDVVGMAVRDVCLFAGEGAPGDEPFPGYDDPGEPQPGPFNESCDVISPPQGDSIGHWISWHWAQLNRFFTCDLMVFLNTQYRTIQSHFRTTLWVARWFMASWDMGIDWMGEQFLPWLAGYLSNIQPGTIVEAEESCEWWNLPCHLSKLLGGVGDIIDYFIREIIAQIAPTFDWLRDTLSQLFNWLLDALTKILDVLIFIISELVSAFIRLVLGLFFLIVEAALSLLMVARQSILELIFAWNSAEPTVLPGFVDCSENPGNNAWCWVLWLSENTLFSGTYGELIIPLFTTVLWILLVIMVAKEIRRLVLKVAELI